MVGVRVHPKAAWAALEVVPRDSSQLRVFSEWKKMPAKWPNLAFPQSGIFEALPSAMRKMSPRWYRSWW